MQVSCGDAWRNSHVPHLPSALLSSLLLLCFRSNAFLNTEHRLCKKKKVRSHLGSNHTHFYWGSSLRVPQMPQYQQSKSVSTANCKLMRFNSTYFFSFSFPHPCAGICSNKKSTKAKLNWTEIRHPLNSDSCVLCSQFVDSPPPTLSCIFHSQQITKADASFDV